MQAYDQEVATYIPLKVVLKDKGAFVAAQNRPAPFGPKPLLQDSHLANRLHLI